MHLYAICVDCLEGVHKIVCIKCKSRWDGSWHQLGTMYTYDILAASPCCQVEMSGWDWVRGNNDKFIQFKCDFCFSDQAIAKSHNVCL